MRLGLEIAQSRGLGFALQDWWSEELQAERWTWAAKEERRKLGTGSEFQYFTILVLDQLFDSFHFAFISIDVSPNLFSSVQIMSTKVY